MKPRDWDAATYDRVSTPQVEWAGPVLDRLELRGDETVLDAGCGSGRVTAMLIERLPQGKVIAVDSSPAMVAKAREAIGDRAEVLLQDLAELRVAEPVDAVFSNAVFHWVLDHERLFTPPVRGAQARRADRGPVRRRRQRQDLPRRGQPAGRPAPVLLVLRGMVGPVALRLRRRGDRAA